jgi:hypothetical protein
VGGELRVAFAPIEAALGARGDTNLLAAALEFEGAAMRRAGASVTRRAAAAGCYRIKEVAPRVCKVSLVVQSSASVHLPPFLAKRSLLQALAVLGDLREQYVRRRPNVLHAANTSFA